MLALLEASPWTWIGWRQLAAFAPCSWRTRISDARKQVEKAGGKLMWNQSIRYSAYRYEPQAPLGREASSPTVQPSFF
jgi:hypothetical protein